MASEQEQTGPPSQHTRAKTANLSKIHADRLAIINGHFELPDETVVAVNKIRVIVEKAATDVVHECYSVKHDGGRVTAVIDQFQVVKNMACDAIVLPNVEH